MFRELQHINERPVVFSQLTTRTLWTDPHISESMLRFHLDGSVDLSSRRTEFVDASVAWLTESFGIDPRTRVLDLGCGPGLYAGRLARSGADVTGVDFSPRSVAYARETAAREGLDIAYVEADYLDWRPDQSFDLVLLIFCDFCALQPVGRRTLLEGVAGLLRPNGSFVFDVCSVAALEGRTESAAYAACSSGGFWSPAPYFEFTNRLVYPDEAVSLDKYVIVEADRTWTIFNWLQHFSPESLSAELETAGLAIARLLGDVAGRPFEPDASEFAVVSRRSA